MSVKSRIEALEKAAGAGVCPACGSGGPMVFGPMVLNDDPPPDTRPDPCPRCGRRPFRFGPLELDGGKTARCDNEF